MYGSAIKCIDVVLMAMLCLVLTPSKPQSTDTT